MKYQIKLQLLFARLFSLRRSIVRRIHRIIHNSKYEYLGEGKDGIVYRHKFEGKIVKFLSSYGKRNIVFTDQFIQNINSYYGYDYCERIGSKILSRDESLCHIYELKRSEVLPTAIMEICSLQLYLLKNGMLIWDFGYSAPNYMFSKSGKIKWVDINSNAILLIGQSKHIHDRHRLRKLDDQLIVILLLSHIARWLLNDLNIEKLVSSFLRGKLDDSEMLDYLIAKYDECGVDLKEIKRLPLATALGWEELKQLFSHKDILSVKVYEAADIDSANYTENGVVIKGYQNFEIKSNEVVPIDTGYNFANTKAKFEIIDDIFMKLNLSSATYLDVGCNLGLYVYLASVKYNWAATGIDYNADYISLCNQVSNKLNLETQFANVKFGDVAGQYDITSLYAVIHHLYARTEDLSGLEMICEKLGAITQICCIVEFPTEHDVKGKKWSSLAGIANSYAEDKFVTEMSKYFKRHERRKGVINSRPFFIFFKS